MDKFQVGQKVRVIKVLMPECASLLNEIITITGPRKKRRKADGSYEWLGYETGITVSGLNYQPREDFLAPLEGDSFERFMDRVLKPVDLGTPINA